MLWRKYGEADGIEKSNRQMRFLRNAESIVYTHSPHPYRAEGRTHARSGHSFVRGSPRSSCSAEEVSRFTLQDEERVLQNWREFVKVFNPARQGSKKGLAFRRE